MYREIKIGEKSIPMLANGATPIRYRMVFGKDIMNEFKRVNEDMGSATDSLAELAFIMSKAAEAQSEHKTMAVLNQESFIDWLEQFEPLDLVLASEDIVNLYLGNEQTLSEVKKKAGGAVKEN
jgi:hypothetical protein